MEVLFGGYAGYNKLGFRMLALLHVKLPFEVLVPLDEQFVLRTYEDGGYTIQIGLPGKSEDSEKKSGGAEILLGGKETIYADVLPLTFWKEAFDRRVEGEIDPPLDVANRAIKSFCERLRYTSKAPQVQAPTLPNVPYRLTYLHDDGSEIPEEAGFVRGRGVVAFAFSWIACDAQLWEMIHELPPDFEAPAWRTLLLDAYGALPHVGSAITLAATALEVFIAQTLDALQAKSQVTAQVWEWINERANRQNDPTVEEQFSSLLNLLAGKSLKEEAKLWEGFRHLKTARNTFVHTGMASVGGNVVTEVQAREYVGVADQITQTIRNWLPEDLRWPVFDHKVEIQLVQKLTGSAQNGAPDA